MDLIYSIAIMLSTCGVAAKDRDVGQPVGNRDCIHHAENKV
jgi:hypothetical protein